MVRVLTHGCWDLLHIGHHRHLKAAREMGDHLTVSITIDYQVSRIKPDRPIFRYWEREEQLKNLRFVDSTFICPDDTGAFAIRIFRPAIFVRGIDYKEKGLHPKEEAACKEVGCQIRFTETAKFSSSDLIKYL